MALSFAFHWQEARQSASDYDRGYAAGYEAGRPTGWVCGAREKMDGTSRSLYLCQDGGPSGTVDNVSQRWYDFYTHPLGQTWKGER